MPVQELPKVLRNLMDTLLEGNPLHSWNIFEERNGQIVVQIKFSDGHIDQPQHASYKRKTPNQVKRDETRLRKHRDRVTTAALKSEKNTENNFHVIFRDHSHLAYE